MITAFTITEGLALATSMHKFLAECNVNAFVYWLGMLAIRNNESLIGTAADGSLEFPKTYDVFGQFSRYIRPGYVRIGATVNNGDLRVSAWKDPATGKFTIVAINTGSSAAICNIRPGNFSAGTLSSNITSAGSSAHWASGSTATAKADGSFEVVVPPASVVTYTGTNGSSASATVFTDDLASLGKTAANENMLTDGSNPEKFGGDNTRIKRATGNDGSITYQFNQPLQFVKATTFYYKDGQQSYIGGVYVALSADGQTWDNLPLAATPAVSTDNSSLGLYGWFRQQYYNIYATGNHYRYARFTLSGSGTWERQIGKVEIGLQ